MIERQDTIIVQLNELMNTKFISVPLMLHDFIIDIHTTLLEQNFETPQNLTHFSLGKDQKINKILRRSENMFSLLQRLSMKNRYFEAWGKFEAICPKNNIAEIYFVMDRSNLHFSFTVYLEMI